MMSGRSSASSRARYRSKDNSAGPGRELGDVDTVIRDPVADAQMVGAEEPSSEASEPGAERIMLCRRDGCMGQQATLVTANKLVHCLFGVVGGTGFPHRLKLRYCLFHETAAPFEIPCLPSVKEGFFSGFCPTGSICGSEYGEFELTEGAAGGSKALPQRSIEGRKLHLLSDDRVEHALIGVGALLLQHRSAHGGTFMIGEAGL